MTESAATVIRSTATQARHSALFVLGTIGECRCPQRRTWYGRRKPVVHGEKHVAMDRLDVDARLVLARATVADEEPTAETMSSLVHAIEDLALSSAEYHRLSWS